jgi:AraC family transcriptional activator of pobA
MKRPIPTYDLYGEEHHERSRFWMHSETIASRSRLHRWEIKVHRHERFFQILYIRGGAGEALVEGRVLPLAPSSIVTMPPGHAHGFRFSRDMDGLVITFVAARLAALVNMSADPLLAEPRVVALDPRHPDRAYLGETLDRLGAALSTGGATSLAEPYLSAALLLIRGMVVTGSIVSDRSRDRHRLDRLDALVATHAREHRPISFYASELGVSPTHLNRLVAASSGRNMTALLAETLLEEARRLLVFTGLSVRDVAANLGFADAAYFSRFFSGRAGMTPRAYRLAERDRLAS